MSQFYVQTSGGGGGGGSSINEIDTQSGNVQPIGNKILLNAFDTTENNVFGIETKGNTNGGNPPGTGAANEADIYLTNRFHGSATTTDATVTTIATCPMVTNPAIFQFVVNLVAYDTTHNTGAASVATVSFRTTGGVPVVLTSDDFVTQDDLAFSGNVTYLGTAANFQVNVQGAVGATIDWLCHGTYTMVS